ncbi:MAG: nucleotide exchange factor GrpE [Patescibacteria group bacterium]|nr:nucleotide exchange factor GrpE [Patescibacteria group bacterium]
MSKKDSKIHISHVSKEEGARQTQSGFAKQSQGNPAQDQLKIQVDELKDQLLRVSADFDNFRKRIDKERADMKRSAKIDILQRLLPMLENFERAVGCASNDEWAKGVCQLFGSFEKELQSCGLQRFKSLGEKFDSNKHEALLTKENPEKKDIVLEEFQPGWELDGTVIKAAKVKVGV